MIYKTSDEKYMARAMVLAKKGIGYTSPNPAVGCIIVKKDNIIARDYHRKAGQPHAEILALRQAGKKAKGADLYVTLEPCSIYGRTPPCTDAIIEAGIRRVIIGTVDPNPKVNGKGIKTLRKAGIEVKAGILESPCHEIILAYKKYISTGLPLITAKYAQSIDGRIATGTGSSQWISSPQSLKFAHQLRASHDAVLIGAKTANIDNPRLTVREIRGRDPVRIVLTSSGSVKKSLRMFNNNESLTIIVTGNSGAGRLKGLSRTNVEIISVPMKKNHLDLKAMLKKLASRGITSILVEGGSRVITDFIRQKLVDRVAIISAPIIIGEGISALGDLKIRKIDDSIKLSNVKHKKIGRDFVTMGDLA